MIPKQMLTNVAAHQHALNISNPNFCNTFGESVTYCFQLHLHTAADHKCKNCAPSQRYCDDALGASCQSALHQQAITVSGMCFLASLKNAASGSLASKEAAVVIYLLQVVVRLYCACVSCLSQALCRHHLPSHMIFKKAVTPNAM